MKHLSLNQHRFIDELCAVFGLMLVMPVAFLNNPPDILILVATIGMIVATIPSSRTNVGVKAGRIRQDESSMANEAKAGQMSMTIVTGVIVAVLLVILFSPALTQGVSIPAPTLVYALFSLSIALRIVQTGCYLYLEYKNSRGINADAQD